MSLASMYESPASSSSERPQEYNQEMVPLTDQGWL